MKAKNIVKIINAKSYNVSAWFLKALKKEKVTFEELVLLIYFNNLKEKVLDVEEIINELDFTKEEVMNIFNSLLTKNLIILDNIEDESGRLKEVINLSPIDEKMTSLALNVEKEENTTNIYATFESEFGRTLSPMEYEIINAWLNTGATEELIIGALKEATYNNVRSLRYIDKIIYEWGKKGFKNMDDVNASLTKKSDSANKELFEYNWLDDENK